MTKVVNETIMNVLLKMLSCWQRILLESGAEGTRVEDTMNRIAKN